MFFCSHPVLPGRIGSGHKMDTKPPVPPLFDKVPRPPSLPKHAWRSMDSPLSDAAAHFPANKPPLPPVSRMTERTDSTQRTIDTHRTNASKKSEKLSEEWYVKYLNQGFRVFQFALIRSVVSSIKMYIT